MKLTIKQTKALDFLEDDITQEVLYGGAAGGGKSALGCYWQIKRRLLYPGTKGLLGRSVLKTLKETTLQTFFEIAKKQGLKRGSHFDLTSSQDKENPNCLVFYNGSLIYLKDLYAYPNDPDFDELGSLEITDAFVDECGQVTAKAKGILKSRLRYKLNDYNLIPKFLGCCNPNKNWPYVDFYKPSKEGTLRKDRQIILALPYDNKHLPASYIESLKGLDKNSRERLLEGNWEYDDDPSSLIEYEKILDCFKNTHLKSGKAKADYLTIDVARFGSDKTVFGIWYTKNHVKLHSFKGLSVTEVAQKAKEYQQQLWISTSNVLADEDGVGGGVVDILGCKGFVNNSRPLNDENFSNLKSQCYFRLADKINKGELFIECDREEERQMIIEELEQVKQYNMDKDGKRQVLPKEKVKEVIGRSPDYSDTLMMRELFELTPVFTAGAY